MRSLHAALIGHPVAQSLSPFIHDYWRAQYGMAGSYELIDTGGEENLPTVLAGLKERGVQGFNVTIPHKSAVMDYCDEIDAQAQKIGAVNCVTIKDGILRGSNTDAYGFMQSLRAFDGTEKFLQGKIVILGAGGAARAVVCALREAGAGHIVICNRSADKAQALGGEVAPWQERSEILEGASLLVNTTCLGMNGQDRLVIDLSALPQSALVCDIVYKPLMTGLLNAAQQRGNAVVDGVGMLLHQAARAFEQWTGIAPAVSASLRAQVISRASS